ncbi:energy-coupling factor ABC transporter ATP-binding protein [Campylobacter sp. VBCF_05 NA6]|uniref:energy-coupling factor ABC transporter ATP-binding protein n=1 Tax=unclassified Campylobacter TaxID=2593542 RepID=UPI0022E9F8EC|nr:MULTISPECIES: ABC transporter ATP-binding protein [unclassified Campylobacter]MDA3057905.1 energy-coupling factor ABC transporter ATP-binding protein [Campylobacter sp. VBCF_04 NA7]MDA3059318.1 energy-coupling factor ABC transporter ATP-binding protein [Campylobacter sp. VBCF_05 NA6]
MSCSVKLRNLSAKMGERSLFSGLNLDVAHKEKIVILGENGRGKTTLLEILCGLRAPSGGEIEIFHEKISSVKEFAKFRQNIGFLFQNSDEQFICANVFDDVAFGLRARNEAIKKGQNGGAKKAKILKFFRKNSSENLEQNSSEIFTTPHNHHIKPRKILSEDEIKIQVDEILQRFGISHLRDAVPYHLSGGEKKLVALAGVIVCEPEIVLLDEPTTGLDFAMQSRVAKILKNLDISEIIVSHDEKFIGAVADKIYTLGEEGLFSANGEPCGI